jgi:hypothetical protein
MSRQDALVVQWDNKIMCLVANTRTQRCPQDIPLPCWIIQSSPLVHAISVRAKGGVRKLLCLEYDQTSLNKAEYI